MKLQTTSTHDGDVQHVIEVMYKLEVSMADLLAAHRRIVGYPIFVRDMERMLNKVGICYAIGAPEKKWWQIWR